MQDILSCVTCDYWYIIILHIPKFRTSNRFSMVSRVPNSMCYFPYEIPCRWILDSSMTKRWVVPQPWRHPQGRRPPCLEGRRPPRARGTAGETCLTGANTNIPRRVFWWPCTVGTGKFQRGIVQWFWVRLFSWCLCQTFCIIYLFDKFSKYELLRNIRNLYSICRWVWI